MIRTQGGEPPPQEIPMKTIRIILASAAFAFAGAAIAGDGNLSSTDKVKKMDADGDSRLSLAEFTAGGHKTSDDFAKYDINGDGYVTDEEIDAGQERGMTPGEKKDVRAKARPVPTTNPKSRKKMGLHCKEITVLVSQSRGLGNQTNHR
ncbi:hypothetical protein CSC74_17225 [Pseudoxanthomonas yeongjuensis]|nr:hypothetical protein CSC74_17225 [Pseudoxanthomonas yeongjuensis]